MNEAEIRKYAMLMQELGLTGLEVKENVGVVRLERAGAAAPAASAAAAEPAAAQSPAPHEYALPNSRHASAHSLVYTHTQN